MKKINKKGFTLIELLIVITIMVILTATAFVPYNHYQNKQKIKNSAKIISQTLYESRNLAINWVNNTSSGNLAIWVSFSGWNDFINIYNYPVQTLSWFTSYSPNFENNNYLSKKIKLENKVKLTNSEKYLFIFEAITWNWIYFKNTENNTDNIKLKVWYKWVNTWNLTKKLTYYTNTYITDID